MLEHMNSVFITGAANGIGLATARRFLDEGWLVGAFDIAEVPLKHPNLVAGHLDVTGSESWEHALAEFAARSDGQIDVLHNNAGVIVEGPLSEEDPDALRRIVEVNVLGVTLGARAGYPYLHAARGQLVNMSSASAVYGQPGIAAYSATKFYVGGLTEALGLEWRREGIRVIDVWPLWAQTSLADNGAASVRRLGVRITAEEVADVVWNAVHPRGRFARGKVHYGVSTLDRLMSAAGQLAPTRVARFLTRLVAG